MTVSSEGHDRSPRPRGRLPQPLASRSRGRELWSPGRSRLSTTSSVALAQEGADRSTSVTSYCRNAQDRRWAKDRQAIQPPLPQRQAALPVRPARPGLLAGRPVHAADRRRACATTSRPSTRAAA
ncbi:MAG: hypothetical protein M0C28_27345 [Candidatus Moduliflexus flocculans]|nr:hypothetical protein [Candidatus Moduliflexus flocculans]